MAEASSRAILYCVSDEKYISEYLISAATVRQYMPSIPIVVYTNATSSLDFADKVLPLSQVQNNFTDKVLAISEVPYDEVLFLDADTFVADDVTELFQLLQRFDIAAAPAPTRISFDLPSVPRSFPELNTGVIVFKRNKAFNDFVKRWLALFKGHHECGLELRSQDQPAFRQALYESELKFSVLSSEYNCRFQVGAAVQGQVKIFHGRTNGFQRVIDEVNRKQMIRWVKWESWR